MDALKYVCVIFECKETIGNKTKAKYFFLYDMRCDQKNHFKKYLFIYQ